MTPLNCIIVDDEKGARVILEHYLSRLPQVALKGQFPDVLQAYHFLKQYKADLILLDINMPEIDGFGLLDMLEQRPPVIFTTASSDFALKSYDYHAVDYLHKPIRFERFVKAIEKAEKWIQAGTVEAPVESVSFRIRGRLLQLATQDILYAESLGNYLALHTRRQKHVVLMKMHEMEQLLPKSMFVRVHKSYLINMRSIDRWGDDQVQISDATIPVGKTYKKYFEEFSKMVVARR